ncbi:MAG: hypothetical protein Q9168_004982 [Polycauliona sp. 1 TL-2023]
MMFLSTLLTPLCLFVSVSTAIDVLLPLYLYPGQDASAWSNVFSTISSHSNVQFQVVVNPNNGPGTKSALTDENHIAGITKLNGFANVRTIGYVLTGYGKRDNALVNADVDVYASWTGATKMDGIYFDEVSNDATQANFDRMTTLSKHARDSIDGAWIVYNPGYRAPVPLFDSCDMMVEFEHPLADYQAEGILAQIPGDKAGKSAVQIIDTPEGTAVEDLVSAMEQKGLAAMFFGEDCCYKVLNQGLLGKMADAAGGQTSTSGDAAQKSTGGTGGGAQNSTGSTGSDSTQNSTFSTGGDVTQKSTGGTSGGDTAGTSTGGDDAAGTSTSGTSGGDGTAGTSTGGDAAAGTSTGDAPLSTGGNTV